MERDPVLALYAGLADDFHLIHEDWDATVKSQGEALDRMICAALGPGPHRLLDCSCGIGTQALGLAAMGHGVHATDISPEAVARAGREAEARGLELTFGVADMRELESGVEGVFDAVISCDNALAHMMTDDDLGRAAAGMAAKAAPGGLVLASIRDYDALAEEKPAFDPPRISDGGRHVVFQIWNWRADGRAYDMTMFVLRRRGGEWSMRHFTAPLRAVLRDEVAAAFARAGLVDVEWRMPGAAAYYQPAVTARKPTAA